jgi:hypothetical protein
MLITENWLDSFADEKMMAPAGNVYWVKTIRSDIESGAYLRIHDIGRKENKLVVELVEYMPDFDDESKTIENACLLCHFDSCENLEKLYSLLNDNQ